MKQASCLIGALGCVLIASTSYGIRIATEYFNDYGTATVNINPLDGGSGWDAAWTGNGDDKAQYTPGARLTWNETGYNNAPNQTDANDGAAVSYEAGGGRTTPFRRLTTPETTVWASALISIDDVSDRAILWLDYVDNGNDFVGVLDGSIQMRYNGVNFTSAGAPTTGTHLLLVKTVINASGVNDSISFWLDPDLSGGELGLGVATYAASDADTFGTSFDGVGFLLADKGLIGNNNETIDSILVGTTYADVIPGPAHNFTSWALTFLPTEIGSETDDFDADGVVNLSEYALGGSPTNAADRGVMPILINQPDGTFKYTHLMRNDDLSLIYTVQTNQDLSISDWVDASYTVLGTNTTLGGVFDEVTNSVPTALPQNFIRLKIEN